MKGKIPVLDHGFVKLLNISCAVEDETLLEQAPAISARISFDNFEADRTKEQDMKLLEYLIKHKHNTPVEMTEVWLEMKLPIFIARQFIRHRTATVNEVSGRYVTLPEEWYIPEVVGGKASSNKQGQEDNLTQLQQDMFKEALRDQSFKSYRNYLDALSDGVAPEHARLFLGLNHYTHWVWKQDLHNLLHFLALRMDVHAQVEARAYANAIYTLLQTHLPNTMKLFDKYKQLS
jgi:thymidylate synthase (FAD)